MLAPFSLRSYKHNIRNQNLIFLPGASLDGVARTVPSANPGQIVPMVDASVSHLNVPVMMDTQDQPVKTLSVEKDATRKM